MSAFVSELADNMAYLENVDPMEARSWVEYVVGATAYGRIISFSAVHNGEEGVVWMSSTAESTRASFRQEAYHPWAFFSVFFEAGAVFGSSVCTNHVVTELGSVREYLKKVGMEECCLKPEFGEYNANELMRRALASMGVRVWCEHMVGLSMVSYKALDLVSRVLWPGITFPNDGVWHIVAFHPVARERMVSPSITHVWGMRHSFFQGQKSFHDEYIVTKYGPNELPNTTENQRLMMWGRPGMAHREGEVLSRMIREHHLALAHMRARIAERESQLRAIAPPKARM